MENNIDKPEGTENSSTDTNIVSSKDDKDIGFINKFINLIVFLCLVFISALGCNYAVLRITHIDYLQKGIDDVAPGFNQVIDNAERAWQRSKLVSVSEDKFIELFKEICPELLTMYGTPLSDVYEDVLAQYEGEKINEEFIRTLLEDFKKKDVAYDGNAFYRMDNKKDKHAPKKPIDTEVLKKDTVSVKFYLDNYEFYSKRIFRTLTKQSKVKFTLKTDEERRYIFQALSSMSQKEFFSIVSNNTAPNPKKRVKKGDQWNIPASQLRDISRIFEIEKQFKDHLGKKRNVTVSVDLRKYSTISADISVLPDGTLMTDKYGPLQVRRDKFFVQRVSGRFKEQGSTWKYWEGSNLIFHGRKGNCVFNKFGSCEKTESVQIFDRNNQTILQMTLTEGSISLISKSGEVFRKITYWSVEDSIGNKIEDQKDLGVKFQKQVLVQGKKIMVQPDLDAYVDTGPLMQRLVHDIEAPYNNENDRARARLAFVQSFQYIAGTVLGTAKTPKDSLISLEGDCEDASIFTVSLAVTAGDKAGFLYFNHKNKDMPGHAAPTIAESSCCSGKGITYGNETWLYSEATGERWRIGQYPGYNKQGLKPRIFQPHGKPPINFQAQM